MNERPDISPQTDEPTEPDPTQMDQTSEGSEPTRRISYRGATSDPLFGFLIAGAIAIGLTPMLPESADLRYTLAWSALAIVGVLAWLLGNAERIEQEDPVDLAWGVGFALLFCVIVLPFFFNTLQSAARLIFPEFGVGTVLAYILFVMPLAETLFFRGVMQQNLPFWVVGGLGGLWSVILFFPVMWGELLTAPAVAIFLAIVLLMVNLLYGYVHDRNGMAAAWVCQIVSGLLLLFFPFL
jgi:hypothetical protein